VVDLGMAAKVRPCVWFPFSHPTASGNMSVVVPMTTEIRGGECEIPFPKPPGCGSGSVVNVLGIAGVDNAKIERRISAFYTLIRCWRLNRVETIAWLVSGGNGEQLCEACLGLRRQSEAATALSHGVTGERSGLLPKRRGAALPPQSKILTGFPALSELREPQNESSVGRALRSVQVGDILRIKQTLALSAVASLVTLPP